ncbi:hypothetical protein AVEN_121333-1 [Araneus ventricosus]|uniref:Uncharacterized protein n=1 Tax=Araneus ventricosus TaxID=182803 RepID=A0A4Y2MLW0_ARAVE|nr:hypothetical protein AVEN_121333-1 [Araneus ventricosus]
MFQSTFFGKQDAKPIRQCEIKMRIGVDLGKIWNPVFQNGLSDDESSRFERYQTPTERAEEIEAGAVFVPLLSLLIDMNKNLNQAHTDGLPNRIHLMPIIIPNRR